MFGDVIKVPIGGVIRVPIHIPVALHWRQPQSADLGLSLRPDLVGLRSQGVSGEYKNFILTVDTPSTTMTYARNQWSRAIRCVDCGQHTPDNNAAENAISSVALGRKNWLCQRTQGCGCQRHAFFLVLNRERWKTSPMPALKSSLKAFLSLMP